MIFKYCFQKLYRKRRLNRDSCYIFNQLSHLKTDNNFLLLRLQKLRFQIFSQENESFESVKLGLIICASSVGVQDFLIYFLLNQRVFFNHNTSKLSSEYFIISPSSALRDTRLTNSQRVNLLPTRLKNEQDNTRVQILKISVYKRIHKNI